MITLYPVWKVKWIIDCKRNCQEEGTGVGWSGIAWWGLVCFPCVYASLHYGVFSSSGVQNIKSDETPPGDDEAAAEDGDAEMQEDE